jgi:predicted helicase
LESPNEKPPQLPLLYKPLGEEHKRAQKVKAETPVLVCIGNPPYNRQQISDESQEKRKGGWIRFGETGSEGNALLRDFLDPLTESGLGVHAKNLYNDYIYFWRWALWKVFESKTGPGIVSFITASSYLRGPGFAGVRKVMRQTFDDLWIIDLEGDNLGARKTDNVFAIQTPVAIAVGVRYDKPQPETPAKVHYTRIDGTQEEKLATLANITSFQDFKWRECLNGWQDGFLPGSDSDYWGWPLMTDLFPWQENGMQFKRTWPIGENIDVLKKRWQAFLNSSEREKLFKETRDRKITLSYPSLSDPLIKLKPLVNLKVGETIPPPMPIAYRSFDRQWAIVDNRIGDYLRPTLHNAHSENQIYITSLLTKVLGEGPAATATNLIPDLDYFCNRGARDIIPLWRDAEATDANITNGVLEKLSQVLGQAITAKDFFAYCYAVLASPQYVKKFWDELTIPGPRIPITKDGVLFDQAVSQGCKLLWLHSYGERFVPNDQKAGKLPPGQARCKVGTPSSPADYPEGFSYSYSDQELRVGKGIFEKVRPQVWEFSVSGFEVVKSWLGYRMRHRSGKSSSPLV